MLKSDIQIQQRDQVNAARGLAMKHTIIDVTPENVGEYGMLCHQSKKKEDGYQSKLKWFTERYHEGLRLKLLQVEEKGRMASRGFIEYVPGEYAWRAVYAPEYLVIHCLWVIGKAKGHGYGTELLRDCVGHARSTGRAGVVAVTSTRPWLVNRKMLTNNGFEIVDTAPPSFELAVSKVKNVPNPSFPTDWDDRQKRYGSGLTVVYADQCPYNSKGVENLLETARKEGIGAKAVRLVTAREVQDYAPSAYGVLNVVYDGVLLSYSFISGRELLERIRDTKK